jgi:hypothetical protein
VVSVTAFFASLHRGEGGDAASPRGEETDCNITPKLQHQKPKKKIRAREVDEGHPEARTEDVGGVDLGSAGG